MTGVKNLWCPKCGKVIDPINVTYDDIHVRCNHRVWHVPSEQLKELMKQQLERNKALKEQAEEAERGTTNTTAVNAKVDEVLDNVQHELDRMTIRLMHKDYDSALYIAAGCLKTLTKELIDLKEKVKSE